MVTIDYRKIIGFGNGGYVVSLPRPWVEKNHMKKGDMLSFEERPDEIIFSLKSKDKKILDKSITIQADNKTITQLKTDIVSAYLSNYTRIELISKKNFSKAQEIKEILRNLAGLEIMEQTSTRLVARDLINISEISISDMLRRMDNITRGMMEDTINCIKGEDHYKSIFHRDNDVNRLFYLLTRVVNNALKNPWIAKVLGKDPVQLNMDLLISIRLEKIADRQKRIARFLRNFKIHEKTRKDLLKLYNEIRDSYYSIMKGYYTKNKKIAFEMECSNNDRIEKCNKFLEENTDIYPIEQDKKNNELTPAACVQIAKITENLNAMATSIKYIARTMLEHN